MTDFEYIASTTELEQSETFGLYYEKSFNLKPSSQSFSNFMTDVAELLNQILASFELTEYQKEILQNFFIAFNDIRVKIDPNRLKSFKYEFNNDDELVLNRNTEKGIINIIINPNECFAFSVIPKDFHIRKSLDFYYEDFKDFEALAYKFFS